MKWVIIGLIVLIVLVAIIYIVGYFLPVDHQASVSITLRNTPVNKVWGAISNPSGYQQWRTDLKNMEVLSPTHWKETSGHGDVVEYSCDVLELNKRFATRILTKDLPYGGSWAFQLEEKGNDTVLTIVENGHVYSPIYRFMSKFIFGHDTTLKTYTKNLEAYLGK